MDDECSSSVERGAVSDGRSTLDARRSTCRPPSIVQPAIFILGGVQPLMDTALSSTGIASRYPWQVMPMRRLEHGDLFPGGSLVA